MWRGPDLSSLPATAWGWPRSPALPHFSNHIRPVLRSAGYTGGPVVDTLGYEALRAVLLQGEPIGSVSSIEWGLVEADSPAGPFHNLRNLIGGSVEHYTVGIGVMWCVLGLAGQRRRYVHATVELHGSGRLVYGVYLELIPAAASTSHLFGFGPNTSRL